MKTVKPAVGAPSRATETRPIESRPENVSRPGAGDSRPPESRPAEPRRPNSAQESRPGGPRPVDSRPATDGNQHHRPPPDARHHDGRHGDRHAGDPRRNQHQNKNFPVDFPITPLVEKKGPTGVRTVENFQIIEQIGEGTYAKVYRAQNRENHDEVVALKKIKMQYETEGFPITAIREIKILKQLNHENIVQLKEIVASKATKEDKGPGIYLVFEYMDHELSGLIQSGLFRPNTAQIKCYIKQILEGLFFCHKNYILHRDIKGSNLLINNKGQLKLADFGLARPYSLNSAVKEYTNKVITLWYRPPELLLGAKKYGPAVDMWSVGCIMAELLANINPALFKGADEPEQLDQIFRLCGTPTEANWPGHADLPYANLLKGKIIYNRSIKEYFTNRRLSTQAIDLLDKLLSLDPRQRITAEQALDHDFFYEDPLPCSPDQLPRDLPSCHEWTSRKRESGSQLGGNPAKKFRPQEPPRDNRAPPAAANQRPPVRGPPNNQPPRPGAPPTGSARPPVGNAPPRRDNPEASATSKPPEGAGRPSGGPPKDGAARPRAPPPSGARPANGPTAQSNLNSKPPSKGTNPESNTALNP